MEIRGLLNCRSSFLISSIFIFSIWPGSCGKGGESRGKPDGGGRPDVVIVEEDGCFDSCHNGIMDCTEDGIDCGGECQPCPDHCEGHCGNGRQDCGEEGTDCGADCPACADPCEEHCGNGQRDCGEDGIDCGGECQPCASAQGLSIRGRWLGLTGADGRWRVGIPTGQLDMTPDDVLDRMEAAGKNMIKITVGAGCYGVDDLWLYNDNDFRDGFDQAAWSRVESFIAGAESRNIGVIIGLWGTVGLEGERPGGENVGARWDGNPWNARVGKGGPYEVPGCGKDAFYSFNEYGSFVYSPGEPYPEDADMSIRGQWRQEEIVYNLAMLAREHPNTALMLMWEADDGGSHQWGDCDATDEKIAAWHAHMSSFVKSVNPSILVSTGVDYVVWYEGLDFITAQVGDPPGVNRYCNAGLRSYPVVSTGWAVTEVEDCCDSGCGPEVYAALPGYIRDGWLCGLQVGAAFWEYRSGTCYPPEYSDPYLTQLRGFFDGVSSWEDEPGSEITRETMP